MLTSTRKVAAVSAAVASLLSAAEPAFADEWKGVAHPLFFRNGTAVTQAMVDYQQGPLLNHCMLVAYETMPSKDRAIIGRAISTAFTEGAGGGVGLFAEAKVMGARLATNAIPGVFVVNFLFGLLTGGLGGNTVSNERFRSGTDACLARYAGGIWEMAPSELAQYRAQLAQGGSVTVGLSPMWGAPRPQGAAFVPYRPQVSPQQPGNPSKMMGPVPPPQIQQTPDYVDVPGTDPN